MKITVEYDDWITHTSYSFSKAINKHIDQLIDRGILYKESKEFKKKHFKAVLRELDTKVDTI
jgi:hypothetical protein